MYRLTPRMEQYFHQSLEKYHKIFQGARCSAIELEELIFKAIQSDNTAGHHAFWKDGGHDDKSDIQVRVNGVVFPLQIKSGKIGNEHLVLSGYRLGRFDGDLEKITEYLKNNESEYLTVPYKRIDDTTGRHHVYQIIYVANEYIRELDSSGWKEVGKQWKQTNQKGVVFSLRPSMSWQIWWDIPLSILSKSREFVI